MIDNALVRDIGDDGLGDDAFHIIGSTVSGSDNSIQGAINSGVACNASGNTGAIGFTSGPIS